MAPESLEKHQLAGFDARERGFSRPVELTYEDGGYRALLRYETTKITTDPHASQAAALQVLIQLLHSQGYTQLRSQLSFHNGTYQGSQHPWIEYSDPPRATGHGLLAKVRRWFEGKGIAP